jgi:NAD(P)-dependent dehydrogenase (short-subunit alcohol dehydrogenase family)
VPPEESIMMTEKKIALITGGNRGVGLETARELGRKGFTVVIGTREVGKAEAALASLRKEGIDVEAVLYDARRPDAERVVYDHLARRYGKLDVLVNNAGVLQEELLTNSALTVPLDTIEDTFAVNVFAVIRLTRALLPLLEKAEAGRIVNVSSILGSLTIHSVEGSPIASAKAFAYDASKTALNAFTVHLADALRGTAIKVNSVHPGWVKTELGGPHATDPIEGSGKTSARLATIGADGPTGRFFHEENALPW